MATSSEITSFTPFPDLDAIALPAEGGLGQGIRGQTGQFRPQVLDDRRRSALITEQGILLTFVGILPAQLVEACGFLITPGETSRGPGQGLLPGRGGGPVMRRGDHPGLDLL